MRAIIYATFIALVFMTAGSKAQECSPNHELSRIVPEHRAIMLDGDNIKTCDVRRLEG
jgi:hypothetical protein